MWNVAQAGFAAALTEPDTIRDPYRCGSDRRLPAPMQPVGIEVRLVVRCGRPESVHGYATVRRLPAGAFRRRRSPAAGAHPYQPPARAVGPPPERSQHHRRMTMTSPRTVPATGCRRGLCQRESATQPPDGGAAAVALASHRTRPAP